MSIVLRCEGRGMKGMMMHWKIRGWTLVGMLLAVVTVSAVAQSSIATTTVTDTIYRADGTAATGTVLVSWPAFSSATGQTIPSGSTSATIAAGGLLSVQLAPNAGATPIGSYYTAVYHLDDGTVSREFWVVPSSQTPVHLSAVKSTVLPTSVAMQTVSKSYVDTAIATAISGHPLDGSTPYVLKSGDTMTGALTLPGDPTSPLQAAEKQYVDTNVTALASGLAQKVATLPAATQTVAQPTGTMLETNRLNGVEYASQYINGRGGNGIANAVASTDCTSGCEVKSEQSYAAGELYTSTTWNDQTHVEDTRGGQRRDTYMNPSSVVTPGLEAGQVIDVTSTHIDAMLQPQVVNQDPASIGVLINHTALSGGSNQFPQGIDSQIPYFKTGYTALAVNGTYNTQGQHVLAPMTTNCYGVGDCLIGSQFLTASGGFRDNADEGTHPMDLQVQEDTRVFQGTCSSGCTTGSTSVTVAVSSGPGTQGDGRFLIDKNPAKLLTTGVVTGAGVSGPHASAAFSGSAFPVSVFFQTAQTIPSQANNVAPGTVTVAIATSGVTAGFATNTAAAPQTSGVACVSDAINGTNAQNYEMANYTVVDGTHLQMTLNKAHSVPATVAIGGLCGYGLEQTVDTASGIRQVFPVVGSYSATGLYYAGGATAIVGAMGHSSAYLNLTLNVASIARSNNVVTVTTAGNLPVDVNGLTLTVSGVVDSSYNGSYAVTTTGPNTLTYSQSGANSTSTGGTMAVLTGGYALYPMAEVLSVLDPATKSVDGQMTLAPNTVAWAANDAVEQPHYFQEQVSGDLTFVGQTTPRPITYMRAGMQYEGNNGPGLQGWTVTNATPATAYLSNGGTHTAPDWAYEAKGVWNRTMSLDAGVQSVFTVHCNLHGCGKWNSGYNLFELDSSVATDVIQFQPTTSTLTLGLRGAAYGFSPQAFTAATVNAETVNATTLNGAVSAAQLPVFQASGSGHAQGVVPDPGATAGTTRFLREDGTWVAPSGGSTALSAGVGPTATAAADYNFLQGQGGVLTDSTANGNNGTLGTGALAPVWTATGLQFSGQQNVSLPAALNTMKSFVAAVYINPLTTGPQPANTYPVMVSSSMGGTGFNYMYIAGAGATVGLMQINGINTFGPSVFGGGQTTTTAPYLFSGFHVLGFVCGANGASVDHFYVDGVEVPSYGLQGTSCNYQSSGNLFLGSSGVSPWTSSGFAGTFYRFITYSTQLTSAQMALTSAAVRNEVSARGVSVAPVPVRLATPQMMFIGDSITYGLGVTTAWPGLLSLTNQPAYNKTSWAITGSTITSMIASEPNRAAPGCGTYTNPAVALVFAGTNDLQTVDLVTGASATPGSVFNMLAGEVQILKRAGCKVFVGTMISRAANDNSGNSYDTDKDGYDAMILGNWKAIGADGVIDFAANPLLGADGANAGAYFQADHVHPVQAGQQILANEASNALNYYFGYNETNPHNVTSLPYSMTAGDGEVSMAGVTGAGTLTLPDCTGQSGATYRINNPQAAFVVTVAPLNASQLINGLAFGTAVTVPANGTLTLRDVPNAKTVSGCHWEM
jgi:trimeric autotransporter adhesin